MSIFKILAKLSPDFEKLQTAEYKSTKGDPKFVTVEQLEQLSQAIKEVDDCKVDAILHDIQLPKTTTAYLKKKPAIGSQAYHIDKAVNYLNLMRDEAKKATGYKGIDDKSEGYQKRLIAFKDHKRNSPYRVKFKKHTEAAHMAIAGDTPMPLDDALWSKFKKQAKKKFDVYPSWVASRWIVNSYKKAGGKFSGG